MSPRALPLCPPNARPRPRPRSISIVLWMKVPLVCVKGRVVHGVDWDRLSAKATGHRSVAQTHNRSVSLVKVMSEIKEKLTAELEVPFSPSQPGLVRRHGGKRPPAWWSRPPVPTKEDAFKDFFRT